jgi:hypothetical protein
MVIAHYVIQHVVWDHSVSIVADKVVHA